MKSVKRKDRTVRKGKTIKRGGAAETKDYPGVGTYVGSIDANGNRQSTDQNDPGIMTYTNGDKFKGFWNKDKATGGQMTYANGDVFRGYWVDSKRKGQGKIQYSDGRIYNGTWDQDKKQGQGTMAYPDGSKYMGQWVDDKRKGPGAISYKNKDEYHGQWVDDKRKNGNGVMIYSNDDKYQVEYQGNFVDDKRNGKGVIVYKNGDQYEGEWLDDMRHGKGIIYYSDPSDSSGNSVPSVPSKYSGNWVQDKRQGKEGGMIYPDGSSYLGNWFNDKRHGEGVLFDRNKKELYRGNWEKDERRQIDVNQIHKFTANINFNELNAFLKEHSLLENPYIEQPTPDDFGVYIKDSMRNIVQSTDAAKKEERLKSFDYLMENTLDKIKYSVYSDNLKTGVFLSLKYAQLQPPVFKEAYVESYLEDNCKAQSNDNDISVENLSCPTGTFERFVTSLSPAATTALTTGTANDEYDKLIEIITNNPKTRTPDLIIEWKKKFFKGKGLENKSIDERKQMLTKYITERVNPTNDPEINVIIDSFTLYAEVGDEADFDYKGGTKRRRKKPRSTKTKTKKTKKRRGKGTK